MTLWKQLCIVILLVFILVFSSIFVVSVHNINSFITQQLGSHAQDTASSLGISLSKSFDGKDMVQLERIADAIFDRGFYQQITIKNVHDEYLYDNLWQSESVDVPDWFVQLITFSPPVGTALIKNGWNNLGTVTVVSNPLYAYVELWNICKNNFVLFLACSTITMLMATILVYFLLLPLRKVTKQAAAICNREFNIQEHLPWTKDFRLLVEAMNNMSLKLKNMFAQHAELSEIMRERSYKDHVTGLGNRRYFESQFEHMLSSTESGTGGALFLLRVADINDYRQQWGYNHGDILLRHIGLILTQFGETYEVPVICHVSGSDFIMIIMNVEYNDLEVISNKLHSKLCKITEYEAVKSPIQPYIGVAQFANSSYVQDVFARAEKALLQTQQDKQKFWKIEDKVVNSHINIVSWSELVANKLDKEEIILQFQPVFFYQNNSTLLLHNEVLLRLKEESNQLICAGMLLPIIEKLNLGAKYDKLVIEMMFDRVVTLDNDQVYAINLSHQSLLDPGFILWLSQLCARAGESCTRISFELPEFIVKDHLDSLKDLIDCLRVYGVKVGLDHFGCGFSSFGYLDQIKVDYIKVHGSYVKNIDSNIDNQLIFRTFVEIAHGLDILVIATSVETEAERETLMKLRVDGMQGYYIGQPV